MTAELEREVANLRREFHECKSSVGDKVVSLEIANSEKLTRLQTQMEAVLSTMSTFVTASRFRPVELIAFGLAGGVLTTALGMVLAKSFGVIS